MKAVGGASRRSGSNESVTSCTSGTSLEPGVIAQRHSSEHESTSARQPVGDRRRELGGVPGPDGVEVAHRQLVQRGMPRVVDQVVGGLAVAVNPARQPVAAG